MQGVILTYTCIITSKLLILSNAILKFLYDDFSVLISCNFDLTHTADKLKSVLIKSTSTC